MGTCVLALGMPPARSSPRQLPRRSPILPPCARKRPCASRRHRCRWEQSPIAFHQHAPSSRLRARGQGRVATAPETGAAKVRCGLVDVIEQCTLYVCLWVAELVLWLEVCGTPPGYVRTVI